MARAKTRLCTKFQTLDRGLYSQGMPHGDSIDRWRLDQRGSGAFDVVEKNIRGVTAVREINIKTRAALRYREWSRRISFLRRYFDPKLFDAIERHPSVLNIGSRTLSICFWDIRGFSYLCEILKANPPSSLGSSGNTAMLRHAQSSAMVECWISLSAMA